MENKMKWFKSHSITMRIENKRLYVLDEYFNAEGSWKDATDWSHKECRDFLGY